MSDLDPSDVLEIIKKVVEAAIEAESTDGYEPESASIRAGEFLSKPEVLTPQSIKRAQAIDKEFWENV